MKRIEFKAKKYDESLIGATIRILIAIFRWIAFAGCVVVGGLTIGTIIMGIVKGANLSTTVLAKLSAFITGLSVQEGIDLIEQIGQTNVIIGTVGYGFANAMTLGIVYVLTTRLEIIYKSIIKKDMFTKENIDIINESIPLTYLLVLLNPIVVLCTSVSTKMGNYTSVSLIGLAFLFLMYIMKYLFDKGYELTDECIILSNENDELREDANTVENALAKIEKLKEQLKTEKEKAKEVVEEVKKDVKKEVKKVIKKEEPKKKEETKKADSKKKTTKKKYYYNNK